MKNWHPAHANMLYVAYKMLVNSPQKLFGMLISATFSSFIIMQQPSIYQGVSERLIAPIKAIPTADLWVMGARSETPDQPTHFDPIDSYRIRSVPGVLWATQLYRAWMWMKHKSSEKTLNWDVTGVDSYTLLGLPQDMTQKDKEAIRYPNAVIVDGYALNQFTKNNPLKLKDKLIEGPRTYIVRAVSKPLRTYSVNPRLYMLSTHLPTEYAQNSFILVKVKPHYKVLAVAQAIHARTNYDALTPQQFMDRTLNFFSKSTPIIIMFVAVGVGGFLIGLIIMWQIFSNFILTHLHQFGMLKMLGVPNSMLKQMVLFQAALIGGVAYLLSVVLITVFEKIFVNTDVACHFTFTIALFGLIGTFAMVFLASFFSLLKVLRLDSVELCRDQN
ncbi:MAG: hypothetical protein A3F18_03785 [Legionellales bacterium RIFCSPHIGHO2_12_FULL_37_14]|nr:MAG: hypothetical protein A3F18_03785 [Legionellales bacterium RIFCSPHIGHO2_12_FULL_37_14]